MTWSGSIEDARQGKWPRHYAARILRLRTAEKRRAALEQVPAPIRGMVEHYVRDAFEKRAEGLVAPLRPRSGDEPAEDDDGD